MRQAQLGLGCENGDLWLCTTCAQCEAYCPRGVTVSDVFRGLRTIAWERRTVEGGLPSLLWSIWWNDNPWSQPPSQRTDWAKDLALPAFDPDKHEILLYVGCTSSFDRRAQKIATSLVKVLRIAGVSFGYLGQEEPCCGEAALSVGHKPYFREIAAETAGVFREKGVTDLVVISPHCYDVFLNHYPTGDFRTKHYTQYLANLIESGRLPLAKEKLGVEFRVAFQDPCYLGRHNGEYSAPRQVLTALPGVELIELPNNRVDGLCCGGGGGRMWLETDPDERFSDLRITETLNLGVDVLVTACPFCVVCLEDSAKMARAGNLQVMDVSELAAYLLPQ
jgi:Fe-S oxidoreductase